MMMTRYLNSSKIYLQNTKAYVTPNIAWLIVAVLLFILVCVLCWKGTINFKNELSLSDLANFIMAVFISFYLPYAVGRVIEKRNSTKALILHTCTELQCEAKEIMHDVCTLSLSSALFQRI